MINRLWLSIRHLVDERNKEAAVADAYKEELESWAHEVQEHSD